MLLRVVSANSVILVTVFVYLHRRTSKSRSKREKKRWSLKEGSPHEEFALVEALWNLVEQTTAWKGLQCLIVYAIFPLCSFTYGDF